MERKIINIVSVLFFIFLRFDTKVKIIVFNKQIIIANLQPFFKKRIYIMIFDHKLSTNERFYNAD